MHASRDHRLQHFARRGVLFVLSSPSGAGKTSLARGLLELEPQMTMSVSVTTRPQRKGEKNGVDYYFVEDAKFDRLLADSAFLEHASIFGYRYGTLKDPVQKTLQAGGDMLFDINWHGAQQLTENARKDMASIFVLPPDLESLRARLIKRERDNDREIEYRMSMTASEISHYPEYQYIVVNRDYHQALRALQSIVRAERLRRERYEGLNEFVNALRDDMQEAKHSGALPHDNKETHKAQSTLPD